MASIVLTAMSRLFDSSQAFLPSHQVAFRHAAHQEKILMSSLVWRRVTADEEAIPLEEDDEDDKKFLQSLRTRIQQQEQTAHNFRTAQCSTKHVGLPLTTTRHISVDYPMAACGYDDVYVVHLESGAIMARTCTSILHDTSCDAGFNRITTERIQNVQRRLLCDSSTETTAVELQGSHLFEARISGGVHVHRLSRDDNDANDENDTIEDVSSSFASPSIVLVSQGSIPALNDCLVTAMQIEDQHLWVGTDQGMIQVYQIGDHNRLPLAVRTHPDHQWNVHGIVTSLSVHAEIGIVLITTDEGLVHVLSIDADQKDSNRTNNNEHIVGSFLPKFVGPDRPGVYPTCATVVAMTQSINKDLFDKESDEQYSIVCGANDGSLSVQSVQIDDASGMITVQNSFQQQMLEGHLSPVKCVTSPAPGLLLSGVVDGTMRLMDLDQEDKDDMPLYCITGFGSSILTSLWSDGTHIVSNGPANTITIFDFLAGSNQSRRHRRGKQSDDWNEDGQT